MDIKKGTEYFVSEEMKVFVVEVLGDIIFYKVTVSGKTLTEWAIRDDFIHRFPRMAMDADLENSTRPLRPFVEIKNWRIEREGDGYVLVGEVFGHPRFNDGAQVRTSAIKEMVTKNTHYKLVDQE